MLTRGQCHLKLGNSGAAIKDFNAVLNRDHGNVEGMLLITNACFKFSDSQDFEDFCKKTILMFSKMTKMSQFIFTDWQSLQLYYFLCPKISGGFLLPNIEQES